MYIQPSKKDFYLQFPVMQAVYIPRAPTTIIPIVNHPSIFLRGYKIEFWVRLPQKACLQTTCAPQNFTLFPKPTLELVLSLKAT